MILPIMDFTIDGPYEGTKSKKSKSENYVYLKIDNKILKLAINTDDNILKFYMKRLIMNLDEFMFNIVCETEMKNCCFPFDMEYVGKFKLPGKTFKTKNYRIPEVDTEECSLIYVLNSIYNKQGLINEDLYNLRAEKEMCEENSAKKIVVEDIISKLDIVVVEEYDYNKLAESVEYVSYITNKENLWNKINLQKLKSILLEAQGNIEVFQKLNLYNKNEFVYTTKNQKVK